MKYEYITATGTQVIEVNEKFNDILMAMDVEEKSGNKKQVRPRHDRPRNISLSDVDYEGEWFADGTDILGDLVRTESYERFRSALLELTPDQRELIDRVYVKNERIVDIARNSGVSEAAIRDRLKKIRKRLKKILK